MILVLMALKKGFKKNCIKNVKFMFLKKYSNNAKNHDFNSDIPRRGYWEDYTRKWL